MPVTPEADKAAFFERIRGDPWICREMGIDTDEDAVKYIIKRREIDDELDAEIRRLMIFDVPADETRGPFERCGIQVDGLAAAANQYKIDAILSQIVALCGPSDQHCWSVNGRPIDKVVRAGDLASAAGYYRAGVRFYYYSATPTQIRTM